MSGDVSRVPSPAVLRNRGVPIKLHDLDANGDRVFGEDDEPTFVEVFVAFNNAVLSDLEGFYGDIDTWNDKLNEQPRRALTATVAFLLEWTIVSPETGLAAPDYRRAGKAMIESETAAYSTAVGAAYMLAEGIPVNKVGEMLAAGLKEVDEGKREFENLDIKKLLSSDESESSESSESESESSDSEPDVATPTPPDAATLGQPSTPDGSSTEEIPSNSGDSVPARSLS